MGPQKTPTRKGYEFLQYVDPHAPVDGECKGQVCPPYTSGELIARLSKKLDILPDEFFVGLPESRRGFRALFRKAPGDEPRPAVPSL